jgi:hypothetical protein
VRLSETGSPLEAEAEIAKAGVRVVTVPGGTNEMVWDRSGMKLAMIDLFESMRTDTVGLPAVTAPDQPKKALPDPAVATTVASAFGG